MHARVCVCVCVCVLDLAIVSHWDIETGDVDLVSGPGHTNLVASLVATPERLHSIGLDKSVRTSSTSTYEFE